MALKMHTRHMPTWDQESLLSPHIFWVLYLNSKMQWSDDSEWEQYEREVESVESVESAEHDLRLVTCILSNQSVCGSTWADLTSWRRTSLKKAPDRTSIERYAWPASRTGSQWASPAATQFNIDTYLVGPGPLTTSTQTNSLSYHYIWENLETRAWATPPNLRSPFITFSAIAS